MYEQIAFVKDNFNSVLLLNSKFFQTVQLRLHPLYLRSLAMSEYMSSRGIVRLFYLNKVLLYIIHLCFLQFYFQ